MCGEERTDALGHESGGVTSVADGVFIGGREFGAGVGVVWRDEEDGVIAETVRAAGDAWWDADASFEGAFGGGED